MALSAQPVRDRLYLQLSLPVFMKEMRVRMRGLRAPLLLGITTALAIVVGLLIIVPGWDSLATNDSRGMVQVGENLFTGITVLEGILCALIAPALTAGAISIEREQQTLDLLLLTRLSDLNILLGKMLSALSFIAMILICTIPVVAISFLLGGVDPAQMCWSAAIIFIAASVFSAIGLYCSTRMAKTSIAVATAYCSGLALLWLPVLIGGLLGVLDPTSTQTYYLVVVIASALAALYPSLLVSALCILVRRRPVPWLLALLSWLVFAAAAAWLLHLYPQEIHQYVNHHPEYIFVGNPVIAIGMLIFGNSWKMPNTGWLSNGFIPLTVGILLCSLLVLLTLALGEFKRLRIGQRARSGG